LLREDSIFINDDKRLNATLSLEERTAILMLDCVNLLQHAHDIQSIKDPMSRCLSC